MELPSTKEELEAKTTAFMADTLHRFNTGRLTAAEAQRNAQAIFAITAGLVDNAIIDLATQLATEVKATPAERSVYLLHPFRKNVVRVRYAPEGEGYQVTAWHAQDKDGNLVPTEFPSPACDHTERSERLARLFTQLKSEGYVLI